MSLSLVKKKVLKIRILGPRVSPDSSQQRSYQLTYYTEWECQRGFRPVLMRQPTLDRTLTWLHFNFSLSQSFCNKKLCSKRWQIQGTCATSAPLHIHRKPCTLYDILGLEFQVATHHELCRHNSQSICQPWFRLSYLSFKMPYSMTPNGSHQT